MKSLPSPDSSFPSRNGISVLTACLFIVGEIAGTGILAFPDSFRGIGWWGGVAVITLGGVGAGYAGVILGKTWLIVEEGTIDDQMAKKSPSLETGDNGHWLPLEVDQSEKVRDPYSVIGFIAYGRWGKFITSFTLMVMLFGASIVQILVCAETLQTLVPSNMIGLPINFCQWIVIVGILLMPLSFLGSPVDFWPVAFFAMSSTSLACLLIIVAIFLEDNPIISVSFPMINSSLSINETISDLTLPETSSPITIKSVLLGISTVIFGYGGASVLPTIQNDMKDKRKFTISVVFAFVIMLLLYLPVSVIAYWKFGEGVKANIIRNLSPSPLVTGIYILITAHVCCAFLIQINPVNLTLESILGVPHSFNWKRCLSRGIVATLAIFTGLTVPKFGKLLNFVGSFAVSLQSFALPAIFYLKLCPGKKMTLVKKVTLVAITLFGLFVAVVSTIYSLLELMLPDSFTLPCFINDCVVLD